MKRSHYCALQVRLILEYPGIAIVIEIHIYLGCILGNQIVDRAVYDGATARHFRRSGNLDDEL